MICYRLVRRAAKTTLVLSVAGISLIATAHDGREVMVSGARGQITDGFVTYYYENLDDLNKNPMFSEDMTKVLQRKVLESGKGEPVVPNKEDQATKDYVEACPANGNQTLGDFESLLSKRALFASYYKINYQKNPAVLEFLTTEDLTNVDRTRPISLLCKSADNLCATAHPTHKCNIPCGGSCCCP